MLRTMYRYRALLVLLCVCAAAGCSDDDDGGAVSDDGAGGTGAEADASSEGAEGAERPGAGDLIVLVANDDGVEAPGIDALVEGLRAEPDTFVMVVAPAEEQSGTGGMMTQPPFAASPAETASGYEAVAVEGFPADAIAHALDEGGAAHTPHVVVSGINSGQNVGEVVDFSGTVGAARAAARRGIPALAVSQGRGGEYDFPSGVQYAMQWVNEHRQALLAGGDGLADVVHNLNVPSCGELEVRGLVEVPAADTVAGALASADCASTLQDPTNDIEALNAGFASLSEVPVEPAE